MNAHICRDDARPNLPMTAYWSASSSCSEIAASDAEICPPRRAYLGRNRDTHDEPNEGLE